MTKVLLVNDDPDGLLLYSLLLERFNFQTVKASNGAEALRLLDETQPDIMVTDEMMPGITGTELCRQVRQTRSMTDLPIILMSARRVEDLTRMAAEVGANDVQIIPMFNPRELVDKIEKLMSEKPGEA